MFHFRHRWETVEKGTGEQKGETRDGREVSRTVVIELQRCSVCEKERARVAWENGRVKTMDPLFVKGLT